MCRTYGIGIMRTARHPNSVLPQWYVSFAKSWVVKSGNAVPMMFPRVGLVSEMLQSTSKARRTRQTLPCERGRSEDTVTEIASLSADVLEDMTKEKHTNPRDT